LELSLGDLIIVELALAHYLKGVDVSMMAGQQCAAIIGKIEYQIGQLIAAAGKQSANALTPTA